MAKNTSIILNDHFETLISRKVESGEYASASEVIRAALRLFEEKEARLEALRRALVEGEQSGTAGSLDMSAVKRKARAKRAA
jgi:antitoxin ParD1/3/4